MDSSTTGAGNLYVVATPIGNLDDFTERAKKTLNQCQVVACEDTRITGKLMFHFSLSSKLVSYREENERSKCAEIADLIEAGTNVALVSDAGYPTLSDPGFRLVRECQARSLKVISIPGPNAAITALTASGMPTHQFLYLGFFPKKSAAVEKILEKWKNFSGSLIFYDSRYKIDNNLQIICEILGQDRFICLARELTKLHETILSGKITDVISQFEAGSSKGEFTIIIGPKDYSFGLN